MKKICENCKWWGYGIKYHHETCNHPLMLFKIPAHAFGCIYFEPKKEKECEMERVCKNCKYWLRTVIFEEGRTVSYRDGTCDNYSFVVFENESIPDGGIRADGCGFTTDENYGCIHFKPKEKE